MITNNSFLDGIIHRQMRKHLLETFDEIYILDLHGNSKKKEKAPDGGKDENVFDIQQGVSINMFVRKNNDNKGLGKVYHFDLYGARKQKFETLNKSELKKIKWNELKYSDPYYFFVPKDFRLIQEYERGFKIDELFLEYTSGVTTFKDSLVIDFTQSELEMKKSEIIDMSKSSLRNKYKLVDSRDWKLKNVINDLPHSTITDIYYRPFDTRKIIYSSKTKGVVSYPRFDVMKNFEEYNIALLAPRQTVQEYRHCFITNKIVEGNITASARLLGAAFVFPIYLYHKDGTRSVNLEIDKVNKIEENIGKTTPEDIFDYIYAVLHSPTYREKYKEFLKIDFPRIPYPSDKTIFQRLVKLGRDLRSLHLFESPKLDRYITTFPEDGSYKVEKIEYNDGNVYINSHQYFGKVPEVAWEFWIGGYQPAQKWLKDRKGRKLTNEDIEHYQKIIVALVETDRIMNEIDKINFI